MTYLSPSLVKRFRDKVVLGTTSQDCWGWNASKISRGYGCIRHEGRSLYAHRLSWLIHNGAIPDGSYILHHCDNPPCVNPLHLFVGNQQMNSDDKISKGRYQPKGEGNPSSNLTDLQINEIRRRSIHENRTLLAKEFGVHPSHVYKIIKRRIWRHL